MDIGDGDLVRLARAGDTAAFRLLVERHRGMARARAARLVSRPDDVDDVVQEAFLQAFVALDRLRDPDRFAAWLAGIVRNASRAAARQAPWLLLPEWPEPLHPASDVGLQSADDLDRADALRAAMDGLPAGQRQAVELYYYADQPAGQIAGSPGAAKASLHRARRRLRDYITANRPDLVPLAARGTTARRTTAPRTAARRIAMTAVRIAHAQPQLDRPADGAPAIGPVLVVLADDAGRRALPLWLNGPAGFALWRTLEPPARTASGPRQPSGPPDEVPADQTATGGLIAVDLASRLLRAGGVPVTGVEIDELGPEVIAAWIEITGPGGPETVTARPGLGLALAAAMDAPVRVADELMGRLAVPFAGDDLLGPVLGQRPAGPAGPLAAPRNLDFADGLDGWQVGGSFLAGPTTAHWQDYTAAAADGVATLRSAVAQPRGDAFIGQAIAAEHYRGDSLTFAAEIAADDGAFNIDIWMHVVTPDRTGSGHESGPPVASGRDWARYAVTAPVPGDAELIRYGVTLAGPGRVALRHAGLRRSGQTR